MKIEILKENLKKGIEAVERIIGKNLSLPVLDNILITTEESFLSLTSTNLETIIKTWILAKIIRKGSVIIPAKFLSGFISFLPDEKIAIEEKDYNLYINTSAIKTKIQGQNPNNFPIIPPFKNHGFLQIDNKKFCQALSLVVDIPSLSQSRPEISGIYFFFSRNNLVMAATDSFRLAEKSISLQDHLEKENYFILSQKSAKELVNVLQESEGALKICFSENQVLFELPLAEINHPYIQINCRLLEGQYPQYQEIIPRQFKTQAVLKREDFLSKIKTASLFANKTNEVRLSVNLEKQELEIAAQNVVIGELQSSIPAKIKGEAVGISFNYKFLMDGLLNIKSSEVNFDVNKEDGPCVLRPVGDFSYLYVLMPIKSI